MNTMNSTLYRDSNAHEYMKIWEHDEHHLMIGRSIINKVGLACGDHVLEIGAGFGRYTQMLCDLGLKVTATEPDPTMLPHLESKFANNDNVSVVQAGAEDLLDHMTDNIQAVCGFHILHHLRANTIETLGGQFAQLFGDSDRFRGWFFIEPNQLNLLYVAQTFLDPAMHFSEEKGIWLTDFSKYLGRTPSGHPLIGRIGLFPPRPILARLPKRIATLGTGVSSLPNPLALYRVLAGYRSETER
jgi:SAM-dependent methyltransferase